MGRLEFDSVGVAVTARSMTQRYTREDMINKVDQVERSGSVNGR